MKKRVPSKLTDDQVKRLREWKPFKALARDCGVEYSYARRVRSGEYRKSVS